MSKNSQTYKRLFSLLGVIPLSVYVIAHLADVMTSLSGPDVFNAEMADGRTWPLIIPFMILVIWIPILFHGFYGIMVARQGRPNLGRFRYWENLKYVVQRLSGVGLLLFIPAHVIKSKILPTMSGSPADFAYMSDAFHNPLTLTVYILGVLGAAYHIANGLWQASIGWGVTVTEKGMMRMQIVSSGVFFAIALMGYLAIYGFFMH